MKRSVCHAHERHFGGLTMLRRRLHSLRVDSRDSRSVHLPTPDAWNSKPRSQTDEALPSPSRFPVRNPHVTPGAILLTLLVFATAVAADDRPSPDGPPLSGYDDAPRIYKVNVCGSMTEEEIALGGSGSAFIYGYCDTHFKKNMTLEESLDFARTAVGLAIKRDNSSGGVIRLASITEEGVKRYFVPGDKVYTQ